MSVRSPWAYEKKKTKPRKKKKKNGMLAMRDKFA